MAAAFQLAAAAYRAAAAAERYGLQGLIIIIRAAAAAV
jgi:hypothetical protein